MKLLACTAILVAMLAVACRSASKAPYSASDADHRDPHLADDLARRAVLSLDEDPAGAEGLLRQALTADLFCGPAHNNLGVLFLKQSKYYEAANEFEWARKLLPGHPEPRFNLGITLERAGQVDQAISSYDNALDVYPEHIPATQALARLLLRADRDDARLPQLISQIAMRGETEQWRTWAQEQGALLSKTRLDRQQHKE